MQILLNPLSIRFKSLEYTLPAFLLVVTVFTKELGSYNLLGFDFDFIAYPFFLTFFVLNLSAIIISRKSPTGLFAFIIVASLISILYLGIEVDGFLKQIIPIVIILSSSFYIVTRNNLIKIFHLYAIIAYYTAIFGIIQVLLSFSGINILIKIPGKLDSIAYEPSHYAAILLPAIVFAFFNFKHYKKEFLVMLTALFFTFNVTGYVVFLVILSIAFLNPIYFIVAAPVVYYILFHVLPSINTYFNVRFIDTLAVITGEKSVLSQRLNLNGTTVSFFSNFEVAKYSVKENFLTGAGLGGHETLYYRHLENTPFRYNYFYGLNAKSGHSLTIRILSEFGIFGFALYIVTIVRSMLNFASPVNKAIALACLSHFLCKSLKLGGYIDYGTPFFFTIMILNSKYFSKR